MPETRPSPLASPQPLGEAELHRVTGGQAFSKDDPPVTGPQPDIQQAMEDFLQKLADMQQSQQQTSGEITRP